MSKQREALQVALDALIEVNGWQWVGPMRVMDEVEDAIAEIRNALAEPEQEPVAWCVIENGRVKGLCKSRPAVMNADKWQPLHTEPPLRHPLDIQRIKHIATYCGEHITDGDVIEITRRVEAAHGIEEKK